MKKHLVIFIVIPFLCFGQENSFDFEQNIYGVITTSENTYLILEQGFIQINKTDIYTEYYRQIYSDSTISNPNTELKYDYNLNFIPLIMPGKKQSRIDFTKSLKVGVFVQRNENGKLNLTYNGNEILDSLLIP